MKFYDLARIFRKVEATTKRGEICSYLAEIFQQAEPREVKIIPYLIQGRPGPPYTSFDFNIDEHRITESLAKASGKSLSEVWTLYKTLGDLGLVAAEVLPKKDQLLSILQVYDSLAKIAQTIGPGSAQMKVELLAKLFIRLSKLESHYIVRIVQGKLRLGVGDATIVEALAESSKKPETRNQIERAYTLSSDLGFVADTLKTRGLKGVEKIGPTLGKPILPALAQRLPSAKDAIKKIGKLIAEPKYDGLRLQLHKKDKKIWLFTRRLEDITHALPDIIKAAQNQVQASEVIIDGEVVGFNPKLGKFLPFQQVAKRRRKYKVEEIEFLFPVRYFVFDILFLNGQDLIPQPFYNRLRLLKQVIKEAPKGPILTVPHLETEIANEVTRSPLHTTGKFNKEKGYSLRFPRLSRFRFDRRAEYATTEQEIIGFYQKQF